MIRLVIIYNLIQSIGKPFSRDTEETSRKDSPYMVAFYNLCLNLKNSNKIKTEGNEAKLYAT
jgi:hypothetical protein